MNFFGLEGSQIYLIIYILIYSVWFIILMFVLIKYISQSKCRVNLEKYKYYREVPDSYGPQVLGYLLEQNNLNSRYLSASILELIRRGIFKVEKTNDDYKLIDGDVYNTKWLDSSEKILKDWLLNELGDGESFNVNDLWLNSNESVKSYDKMFRKWKNMVKYESNCMRFFKYVNKGKYFFFFTIGIVFILIVSGRLCFIIPEYSYFMLYGMLFLFFFTMFVYSYIAIKLIRTERGHEEYAKVMGLKRFLKEFGRFDYKQIEEVHLWEQYLVWATALGIADNVQFDLRIIGDGDSKNVDSYSKELAQKICFKVRKMKSFRNFLKKFFI